MNRPIREDTLLPVKAVYIKMIDDDEEYYAIEVRHEHRGGSRLIGWVEFYQVDIALGDLQLIGRLKMDLDKAVKYFIEMDGEPEEFE